MLTDQYFPLKPLQSEVYVLLKGLFHLIPPNERTPNYLNAFVPITNWQHSYSDSKTIFENCIRPKYGGTKIVPYFYQQSDTYFLAVQLAIAYWYIPVYACIFRNEITAPAEPEI